MNEILFILFSVAVYFLLGASILAVLSADARSKFKVKRNTAKVSSVIFFLLSIVAMWFDTPTRLGEHIYFETDYQARKRIVHTNSSCFRIKDGYSIIDTKKYSNLPDIDEFCSRCVYKSDALKLSKKK